MKDENQLALIISFYLSKFDRQALEFLGYKSFSSAFSDIGRIIRVNPNTIKNMRDEYDPLHANVRVGWYRRDPRPSRLEVAQALDGINERTLGEIVRDILQAKDKTSLSLLKKIIGLMAKPEGREKSENSAYLLRGVTGRKAEELFVHHFKSGQSIFKGDLMDVREQGAGYDFKVISGPMESFIEVKGVGGENGGIAFTDKEWRTAIDRGDSYYLVIVRNISEKPQITCLRNPAKSLNPNKRLSMALVVNWVVQEKFLKQD